MEDVTFGFQNPSIIDIKMGTSSVGEDATPQKRKEMEEKDLSTTTVTLGIRIVGGRVCILFYSLVFCFFSLNESFNILPFF
jgi:hypothetical protein